MNLIRIFFISIFCLNLALSKLIFPQQVESQEMLNIYNKDREYFRLIDNKLTYFIEGPSVLTIYSRIAFPKMLDDIKSYYFNISIDESDSFNVSHNHRKDLNVKSMIHPGHGYTISGKDIINIPKGQHKIELTPLDDKSRILIRCVSNKFKKTKDKLNEIVPKNYEYINSVILKTKEKSSKYYSLSKISMNNVFFNVQGPSIVKIISRLSFDDKENKYYHFKVRKDGRLISNHHMISEFSKGTKVLNDSSVKVGKYRTTYISVPDGTHEYELELVSPSNKEVYFRFEN